MRYYSHRYKFVFQKIQTALAVCGASSKQFIEFEEPARANLTGDDEGSSKWKNYLNSFKSKFILIVLLDILIWSPSFATVDIIAAIIPLIY